MLNPANPPLIMRNTVFAAVEDDADPRAIARSVERMVEVVRGYVPGHELVAPVQVDRGLGPGGSTKVSMFLRVRGAGDYLPEYAGNLDIIITAGAVATAERLAPSLRTAA